MTATYDPTESNDVSRVRGIIGDTDAAAAHFADEVITARLTANEGSVRLAAASLLDTWAMQLSSRPAKVKAGEVEHSYLNEQIVNFRTLAERLRSDHAAAVGQAVGGGWHYFSSFDPRLPRDGSY